MRQPDKELSGGVVCDGFGSAFGSLFGVLPNTSFSQNVGLVTMTKIVNRFALATGAIFLILCGLFPKLAALISIHATERIGGAAVMMFSSIVISGIQLITKEPLTMRNITVVSVALGLGYGIGANSTVLSGLPEGIQLIFGGSGIVPAALVAIIFKYCIAKRRLNKLIKTALHWEFYSCTVLFFYMLSCVYYQLITPISSGTITSASVHARISSTLYPSASSLNTRPSFVTSK